MLPPLADMFRAIHDAAQGHDTYAVDYVMGICQALAMVSEFLASS